MDGKTDCGGMALIHAAVMRANGIPARLCQGQIVDLKPAKNYHPETVTTAEHLLGFHAKGNLISQQYTPLLIFHFS